VIDGTKVRAREMQREKQFRSGFEVVLKGRKGETPLLFFVVPFFQPKNVLPSFSIQPSGEI